MEGPRGPHFNELLSHFFKHLFASIVFYMVKRETFHRQNYINMSQRKWLPQQDVSACDNNLLQWTDPSERGLLTEPQKTVL